MQIERPTLSPAEYRKARAVYQRENYDKLRMARALDAYDRAVKDLRGFIAADANKRA